MLVEDVLTQFGLTAPGQAGMRLHTHVNMVLSGMLGLSSGRAGFSKGYFQMIQHTWGGI